MKSIKYSKFLGFDLDSLSLEDLLHKLADYLLQSGFRSDYGGFAMEGDAHTLESLF